MSRNHRSASRVLWVLAGLLALCPVAQAADADHLVVTEFMVKTRTPYTTFGSPFIEISNPTAGPIDMSRVYITDGTTAPTAHYHYITLNNPGTSNPGGGVGGDFHARFPDGFSLAAGQSVTVSLNGSTQFNTAYGRNPDFELYEDALAPDAVADLVEAFPGSVNAGPFGGDNIPALSDLTESIVLYTWDGSSDLVQDVDYVFWGSSEAVRVDKTGVIVGSGTYAADTAVASQDPAAATGPNFGQALRRNSADEGTETLTGGNGLTGHDETSENLSAAWAIASPAEPAPAISPAFPSAPVVSELTTSPSRPYADVTTLLTATVLSFGSVSGVDFMYSVDGGAYTTVAGTYNADEEAWQATLPAQAAQAEVSWYVEAEGAEGGLTTAPVAAPRYVTTFTVGDAPVAGEGAEKLLITEVSTGENVYPYTGMSQIATEFIEIHNPNSYAVDMSDYYITDAINYAFSTQLYWYIANGLPSEQGIVGGGHYNDFTARFPDGYTIGANQTITVSIAGSGWFSSVFGIMPDLEMYEDGTEADDIPDMRTVFGEPNDPAGNSIHTPGRPAGSDDMPRGIPELEEFYGEPLILYHWTEGDDLVTDIDLFLFGNSKTGDFAVGFDKTGETFGTSAYLDDTPIATQDWYNDLDQSGTVSYSRISHTEGNQVMTGGNGVDGRDETSEDLSATFEVGPFSPGVYYLGGGEGPPVVTVELKVEAKTFIPTMGEQFPVSFKADAGKEIKVRLFDLEGRMIYSLFDNRFDSMIPGLFTTVWWDGRDANYERVRAGMYIVHLSVVDERSGEEETITAPVVVATRLSK